MEVELKDQDNVLRNKHPFLDNGDINKGFVEKVKNRKVFVKKGDKYYFPISALDHIAKNFDNCLIKKDGRDANKVTVVPLECPNRNWDALYFVHNGELLPPKKMCEYCNHMIESYVGECAHLTFEPYEKDKIKYQKNGNTGYLELKPGYAHCYDFDSDIYLDPDTVLDRIYEYKKRGMWQKFNRKIKEAFCEKCYKYKTNSCKTGFSAGRNPIDCMESREEVLLKTKEDIIKEYGSMSTFYHMLLQCGQTVDYKDPKTKRTSKRIISMPVIKKGVKGFYMSWTRYPYGIDHYGTRWYGVDKKKKHENFISFYKLKKLYGKKKGRYKKDYDETLCCAYLFLRKANPPGRYISVDGFRNYFVYLRIGKSRLWNNEDTYLEMTSGTGDSTGIYTVNYKNLTDLAEAVNM